MMRLPLLMATLLLMLGGCGYHAPGIGDSWLGGEGRTLYVELFANRTTEPYLDSVVTEEIAMQMSRSRLFELVEDRQTADLLLGGTVIGFDSNVVAYDADDRISEYAAVMLVNARLVRSGDRAVLWQGELQRSETYPAAFDKNLRQEGESLAGRIVAKRIAEDLLSRFLSAF